MLQRLVTGVRGIIHRHFPERQILVRSRGEVHYVPLSPGLQITVCAGGVLVAVWFLIASVNLMFKDAIMTAKDERLAEMSEAYSGMSSELARLQQEFLSTTREIEQKHQSLDTLLKVQSELQEAMSMTRERILGQLPPEKPDLSDLAGSDNAPGEKPEAALGGPEHKSDNAPAASRRTGDDDSEGVKSGEDVSLLKTGDDVSFLYLDGTDFERQVRALEQRLNRIRTRQRETILAFEATADRSLSELEALVIMTGLDVDEVITAVGEKDIGVGGPLVAISAGERPDELDSRLASVAHRMDRLASLNVAVQSLPLISPVDDYYISSNFGRRRDPFSKKWAFHSGLDMGGHWHTPVLSTAPGKVVFAGNSGPYGRMVEIDHGHGIKTRYGHLSRISVEAGDEVVLRQKIGLMGSTGRSSGTHLHYEIWFDGKVRDPRNFMKAGQHVLEQDERDG